MPDQYAPPAGRPRRLDSDLWIVTTIAGRPHRVRVPSWDMPRLPVLTFHPSELDSVARKPGQQPPFGDKIEAATATNTERAGTPARRAAPSIDNRESVPVPVHCTEARGYAARGRPRPLHVEVEYTPDETRLIDGIRFILSRRNERREPCE